MICNNCSLKAICIVYADISKHSMYTEISINKCNYSTNKTVKTVDQMSYQIKKQVDRDKLNELSNNLLQQKKIEEKNKKKDEPKIKLELKAEPLKLDRQCNNCKAETFKEDIAKCSNCNEEVCSCCATVDGDTKNILCEKCWKEL